MRPLDIIVTIRTILPQGEKYSRLRGCLLRWHLRHALQNRGVPLLNQLREGEGVGWRSTSIVTLKMSAVASFNIYLLYASRTFHFP